MTLPECSHLRKRGSLQAISLPCLMAGLSLLTTSPSVGGRQTACVSMDAAEAQWSEESEGCPTQALTFWAAKPFLVFPVHFQKSTSHWGKMVCVADGTACSLSPGSSAASGADRQSRERNLGSIGFMCTAREVALSCPARKASLSAQAPVHTPR